MLLHSIFESANLGFLEVKGKHFGSVLKYR